MLKWLAIVSATISGVLFAVGVVSKIYMLPVVFILSFAAIIVCFLLSCVICTCFVNTEKPCRKQNPIFRFYSHCILSAIKELFRIKLHMSGFDKLPAEKFLLVGNHRSVFDPILTMDAFDQKIGFVAKKSLFEYPILKKLLHEKFCLPLDRSSKRKGLETCLKAVEYIKSGTVSMAIYPEGTTGTDNKLLPFKKGAFSIAQKAKCPIVVAVIKNSENVSKNAPFKKTDVYLDLIGVLDSEFVSNAKTEQISDAVKEMIENDFQLV